MVLPDIFFPNVFCFRKVTQKNQWFLFRDPPNSNLEIYLAPPKKKHENADSPHPAAKAESAKMLQNQLSIDQNSGYMLLGDEILSRYMQGLFLINHEIFRIPGTLTNEQF